MHHDALEHDLAIGQHNFEATLAAALAIERDPSFRLSLGRGTTAVALGSAGPYVIVEDGALDTDDDCGTFDGDGYFPAILAIASLAIAPASVLFSARDEAPNWHAIRAVDVLARTQAHAAPWMN